MCRIYTTKDGHIHAKVFMIKNGEVDIGKTVRHYAWIVGASIAFLLSCNSGFHKYIYKPNVGAFIDNKINAKLSPIQSDLADIKESVELLRQMNIAVYGREIFERVQTDRELSKVKHEVKQ